MTSIAVVILTFNEEMHIARAIASAQTFASEIFVVDSFSDDRTVEIASSLNVNVLTHKFVNYSKQFAWALDNIQSSSEWIVRLDADEIVEPDLAREILRKLGQLPAEITGVNLRYKLIFQGRWVRWGGRYPLILLRIWRKGVGAIEDRWMDEHIVLSHGKTITFDGNFADHNLKDLTFFTSKHNGYATREAIDVLNQRLDLFPRDRGLSADSTSKQASAKRFMKERIYNRTPFAFSALAYFLWRYVFLLGFLDGRAGLVYHFLQGYWYRFLVGAKVNELERAVGHLSEKQEIVAELSRLTGLRLTAESA